ncbi:beta-lactamase regulating signal transducer with metallopeptidase domain [Aequitasia blattaphilus]|uniref:M56 family metallopeptidase n=1 Tax=Aequitasia blattaphilus TaxID=2949332 RepID=A0ABT1EE37_9FIRM|nr:M56 family metallopeptidase [Aequitasia blattaphilus]MCP1103202.1 M56 family metallopeptidase [Aequitasia blattaphilus]MCR8615842.1 M56 family metallopeptidase [Aequitasia blattaphilus]
MNSILGQINTICTMPVFFLLVALVVKCLLLSIYCLLIYQGIRFVQKKFHNHMGARTNYYVWYGLLLSFPLSCCKWNDSIKLPIYRAIHQEWRAVLFIAVAFWLSISMLRLAKFIVHTWRIKQLIAAAAPYRDRGNLKLRVANTVGLQEKYIHIAAVEWVGSPVSYGMFKKTILLPAEYEKKYTSLELELLLLHEMVHIKNRDTMKLCLFSLISCFIWVLRLFDRPFKRDIEILCDNQVIGFQNNGRNTYGELLIKECSTQTVVKGLSFSDSYRTIASRLEALYHFKPEKPGYAVVSIISFAALALSLLWLYHHPASWFIPNDSSYKKFDVNMMLAETNDLGELEYTMLPLPTDVADQVYTVSEEALQVNVPALSRAIKPYQDEGLAIEEIWFQSVVYSMDLDEDSFNPVDMAQTYVEYTLPCSELEQYGEDYRYFPQVQNQKGSVFIYSLIARWL